jgi:phosphomannomutase
MTLIKSISGIRGTIGGECSENLTPLDIVKFTSAYAVWLKETVHSDNLTIVIGRDTRVSGEMARNLVAGTLMGSGIHIIDLGLASTPTTEIAVTHLKAHGGIILTASHNPAQWNALKLLNSKGEFISANDGARILELVANEVFEFASYDTLGRYSENSEMQQVHIDEIIKIKHVDVEDIRKANFTVAIDCVNSVGGIIIPYLLKCLGVRNVIQLYCEPTGIFPHNPEPLPENLTEIANIIKSRKADVGFVVDPDVDRLAILNEDGSMFGEEYTLVAVADYILGRTGGGNTVSNLSSTQALKDVTEKYGGNYESAAVGEVNVVEKMKQTNAVIGGEGNGGVIYPGFHYGRDALVGIALFLTQLAKSGLKCSELRAQYPNYSISKNKIELKPEINIDLILKSVKQLYANRQIIDTDGVKIVFEKEWIHLRKSNTEPIIRIYTESTDKYKAEKLASEIIHEIKKLYH